MAHTWALDVADDGTGLVVHELDTALSDTTTGACRNSVSLPSSLYHRPTPPYAFLRLSRACRDSRTGSAKDTSDLDELDGSLSGIHDLRLCV